MNRILNQLAVSLLLLTLACGGGTRMEPASASSASTEVFPVETLQSGGDPANRINLVLLGDGYRQQDQAKLTRDAQAWLAAFKGAAPYGNYAGYFNVKLVHVVSREDGADNGMHGPGVARDTALGAAFQNASPAGEPPDDRLLVVDNARALAVASAHVPECTKVLVMVNDANYGGSGGAVPVFSVHPESGLIALHELGHSFGGLADEYATGDTSPLPESLEAYPNVTAQRNPALIKWKAWIEGGTPLPTPEAWADPDCLGLFEGAYYHASGVFRPRHNCRMRSLDDTFCDVCGEAIIRGVYGHVSPIDGASPASPLQLEVGAAQTFALTHPTPSPDTLQVVWSVDGVAVAGSGDRYDLPGGSLAPGVHQVSACLRDGTPQVRLGREGLAQIHTWTISVGDPIAAPQVAKAPDRHLLLRVIRDGSGFRVVDQQIIDLPLSAAPNRCASTWQVDVQDAGGQVLFSRELEDPVSLRGEFRNAADPTRIDAHRPVETRAPAFLLRMPLVDARRLEIFQRRPGLPRRRLGGAPLQVDPLP